MSRCRQTDALLDASFAGPDLTRAQAEHVRGCAECARAMSQARRFENELGRVGLELSPETMPAAAEVVALPAPTEGDRVMRRRTLVGGPIALVALVAVVVGGSQWLGSLLRGEVATGRGAPITAAEAAALVGVPRNEVLLTEDGALTIRDLGLTLELVLVRQTGEGIEQYVVDTTPPNGTSTTFSTVTCAEEDQLSRTEYVWGRWEDPERVEGPGRYLIDDEGDLIFALDADASLTESHVLVFEGGGWSQFAPNDGAVREQACLLVVPDLTPDIREPRDLRCSHWLGLDDATRQAVTEALVGEDVFPAVRERQQLTLAAGRDESLAAALGSIDKACQFEDRAELLRDIVTALYGDAAP